MLARPQAQLLQKTPLQGMLLLLVRVEWLLGLIGLSALPSTKRAAASPW